MNPTTDIIFSITWLLLLVWAVRSIFNGWTFLNQDSANPNGVWTTRVTKALHPEMVDVKPGEELMGVTFQRKTECDLEEYRDLQSRIEELKLELESDDDDDDGGNVPAIVRK